MGGGGGDDSGWPLCDILRADASSPDTVLLKCCAKTEFLQRDISQVKQDRPFASADPRPRLLTHRAVKTVDPVGLAVRVNEQLSRAFPPRRLLCVVNPRSGSMRGRQLFAREAQPVLEAAGAILDVRETSAPGDARQWAFDLDIEAFDGIAVCGGDGTLNEVLEGLTSRRDAATACTRIALSHLGGGTSNAIACNIAAECDEAFTITSAAFLAVRGVPTLVDAGRAWLQDGSSRPMLLSLQWALIADIDEESEWLRGCCPWPCGCTRYDPYIVKRGCCLRSYPALIEYLPASAAGSSRPPAAEFYGRGGRHPRSTLLTGDVGSGLPSSASVGGLVSSFEAGAEEGEQDMAQRGGWQVLSTHQVRCPALTLAGHSGTPTTRNCVASLRSLVRR